MSSDIAHVACDLASGNLSDSNLSKLVYAYEYGATDCSLRGIHFPFVVDSMNTPTAIAIAVHTRPSAFVTLTQRKALTIDVLGYRRNIGPQALMQQ